MIRPLLTPRKITGNATIGLVSAARNSVRNIKRSTDTISNAPGVTKEQKFGMNYVGFFGSKKNSKILDKSLKTIRDSMVSTFGIANALKIAVKTGQGIFGFIGKIFKFAGSILNLLPFSGIIKAFLVSIAVGGLGGLFLKFKDQILGFFERSEIASKIFDAIKSKAKGFTSYIKNIIAEFIVSRAMSKEFQTLKRGSQSRLDARIKKAEESGVSSQSAVIDETENEIRMLKEERKQFTLNEFPGLGASSTEKEFYRNQLKAFNDRITELQTGRVPVEQDFQSLGILSGKPFGEGPITLPFTKRFDFIGKFAGDVTAEQGIYSTKNVENLSAAERLNLVKSTLREFENREDISKAKLIYQRELRKGNLLNKNQAQQALDIIDFLDLNTSGDPLENNEKIDKQFVRELQSLPFSEKIIEPKVKNYLNENMRKQRGSGVGGRNGTNISVLPMGNNSTQPDLVRNDTGGLTSGPSMRLYANVDHDNFVALINKSSLNVV